MKKLLVISLTVPLFLLSCGKTEEVKTVVNPPVIEKRAVVTPSIVESPVVTTGGVVESSSGKIEEVSNSSTIDISLMKTWVRWVCASKDWLDKEKSINMNEDPKYKQKGYFKINNSVYFLIEEIISNSDAINSYIFKYNCKNEELKKLHTTTWKYIIASKITDVGYDKIYLYELGFEWPNPVGNYIVSLDDDAVENINTSKYKNNTEYPYCWAISKITSKNKGIIECANGNRDLKELEIDLKKHEIN